MGSASTLWRAYLRARSARARNRLVEHYQPHVRDMVRRFERRLPRSVDRGDLATAANFGLIAAIEAFDLDRGVPFELYCEHRVRGALLDELRNLDWLPRPWRSRLELHRRTVERLRAELGREPSDEEIAAGLGLEIDAYRQDFAPGVLEAPRTPAGLAVTEGAAPGLDVVPDQTREAVGERLGREDLLRLVAQKLSVQEHRLVYLKYWEELSMREIGELLGLSESRVCKIHAQLLERLRDRLRSSADTD
jgi:RNA polymerase sigma factor for flagellar operon FliA